MHPVEDENSVAPGWSSYAKTQFNQPLLNGNPVSRTKQPKFYLEENLP
jgi:hypothetical protein